MLEKPQVGFLEKSEQSSLLPLLEQLNKWGESMRPQLKEINALVNGNGKIIAVDLHGYDLEIEL